MAYADFLIPIHKLVSLEIIKTFKEESNSLVSIPFNSLLSRASTLFWPDNLKIATSSF